MRIEPQPQAYVLQSLFDIVEVQAADCPCPLNNIHALLLLDRVNFDDPAQHNNGSKWASLAQQFLTITN